MSIFKGLLRKVSALLMTAGLIMLCSCRSSQEQSYPEYSSHAEIMNEPAYCKLYTYKNNTLVYSVEPVTVDNEGKYQAVARALMGRDKMLRESYEGIFSPEIELRSVRRQGDILYLNFSDDLRYEPPLAIAQMLSCLANTFTDFDEINYISVACEGRQLVIPDYNFRPVMALDGETDDAQALLSSWKSAQSAFELAGETYKEEADVLLYFRAASSGFYEPEARSITFKGTDYADQLINQLLRGPAQDGLAVFEEGVSLFKPTEFDGQTLSVSFLARGAYPLQDQLWNAVPAIALTVAHLYPDMRNIAVDINVQTEEGYDTVYSYSSGIADFMGLIRTNEVCYFPNQDFTGLTARTVAVKAYDELETSDQLLRSILEGRTAGMTEIAEVLSGQSELNYENMVRGLYRTGECLNINFSRDFYESLSRLSYEQERFFAYAIINTLCYNSGFESVRFLADGAPVETLGGYISALRPIIPDYGIFTSYS